MSDIVARVRRELASGGSAEVRLVQGRFFREEVFFHGLKAPTVRKIARDYYQGIMCLGKRGIYRLCEQLWRSGYIEEALVACEWSYAQRKNYDPDDLLLFEKWLKLHVSNWATCDTLCNHPVGALLEMYPRLLPRLREWAVSENRWLRRAAAVSLIVPARKGLFLNEIITLADILLRDGDDMVQKGYGWLLKVASQKHQRQVFEYVIQNKGVMPRTALRYAIEKMPPDLRRQAMAR